MFPILLSVLCLVHLKQGTAVVALLLELAPILPWMLGDQDVMSHCLTLSHGAGSHPRDQFCPLSPVGCGWFGVKQTVLMESTPAQ